ncbi:9632_t:CDS:2, partial [Funneliformis geosporum]
MAQCLYFQTTTILILELDFIQKQENLKDNTNNSVEMIISDCKAITIPKTAPIIKKLLKKEQNMVNYESINDNNHEFQELENVQNPLKSKTKDRPLTKRYKSSIKYEKRVKGEK